MRAKSARFLFADNPGPGVLISVDGLDGAGKTALVTGLIDSLTTIGVRAVGTRFPTQRVRDSEFFDLVQRQGRTDVVDPVAFEVEYMVDRIQHCRTFIEPALRAGSWVVVDRYALSSVGTLLLRLPDLGRVSLSAIMSESWFEDLCRYLVRPDLALMLQVDPAAAISRLNGRQNELDRYVELEQYGSLQQFALGIAAVNGMTVVDANEPIGSVLTTCITLVDRLRMHRGIGP